MSEANTCYISVDIETSGPIPADFSLLSLGACVVARPEEAIYLEFKPLNENVVPEALCVSGLDMARLALQGQGPRDAMQKFAEWIATAAANQKPVFVGLNAGFDWSFVNWYFIHFCGENPFGFAPLDIKAYYMGLIGCSWEETKSSRIRPEFQPMQSGDHHALNDARAQGEMFTKMRAAPRR
jgi:DNA polymerase III epsilon subunit-like protein